MIEPSRTCVGVTSGTKSFEPGTLTRTVPVTGSRLTLCPAIGRGSGDGPPPPARLTWTSAAVVYELPARSVAVAFGVKSPTDEKAWATVAPSALCPSPKSQWIDAGPLHV